MLRRTDALHGFELNPPSPCHRRGFLFLQQHQALPKGTFNIWHHYPAGRRFLSRFCHPSKPYIFPPTAKQSLLLLRLCAAFIASAHSPNTSFPITILNAMSNHRQRNETAAKSPAQCGPEVAHFSMSPVARFSMSFDISSPGGLTSYQRKRGIDTPLRERVG